MRIDLTTNELSSSGKKRDDIRAFCIKLSSFCAMEEKS